MNIFVLDQDPVKAANLLDKHAIKMPLESQQLLSTVAISKGFTAPYKPTHTHHPCNLWLAKDAANWAWLCEHGIAICHQYTIAYHKVHKCQAMIEEMQQRTLEIWGEVKCSSEHTPFVLCMPVQYKVECAVESYGIIKENVLDGLFLVILKKILSNG